MQLLSAETYGVRGGQGWEWVQGVLFPLGKPGLRG